ncbi:MAG: DUF4292 domain-containing protein, partial [Prevotella sp.]|nr:DUF4292 domain-containing protein [Prevotella sp.]
MKSDRTFLYITVFCVALLLVSCGTSKSTVESSTSVIESSVSNNAGEQNLEYLRKVYDNEVYAQNISSKIKFTLTAGSKDVSVSGSLKMKKDEVIRIQLTPLGIMEAGRIEFTKDYVLIMDRINKEYIKADYSQVDFLKENGLDFYALQALLWN